jgi:hypothetical protein
MCRRPQHSLVSHPQTCHWPAALAGITLKGAFMQLVALLNINTFDAKQNQQQQLQCLGD